MGQSSPRTYQGDKAAAAAEHAQSRKPGWSAANLESGRRGHTDPPWRAAPESGQGVELPKVRETARVLAGRLHALQQRYEEDHRRLVDTLEYLSQRSQELERELLDVGRLIETLEEGLRVSTSCIGNELWHGSVSENRRDRAADTAVAETSARSSLEHTRPAAPSIQLAEARGMVVRCLGKFEVTYQGRPVDLGTSRNGRLIFKYLVARAPGRMASKELLSELFWRDMPAENARSSLQSALHQLKRAIGRTEPELAKLPVIVYGDDQYRINPELELYCDVELFRKLVADARASEARGQVDAACRTYSLAQEVYVGDFLPEERYVDWVNTERASLEAEHMAVLTRLVTLHLEHGDYLEGVRFGNILLELDNLREDVQRDVMRCYSRLGQRSAALKQYRRCLEAVRAELDLPPEPETVALHERLTRGESI